MVLCIAYPKKKINSHHNHDDNNYLLLGYCCEGSVYTLEEKMFMWPSQKQILLLNCYLYQCVRVHYQKTSFRKGFLNYSKDSVLCRMYKFYNRFLVSVE